MEIEFNGVAVSVAASEDWRLILVPGASKRSGFPSFRYTNNGRTRMERKNMSSRGLPSITFVCPSASHLRESRVKHVHACIYLKSPLLHICYTAGVTQRSDESETRILHVVSHLTTQQYILSPQYCINSVTSPKACNSNNVRYVQGYHRLDHPQSSLPTVF